MRFGNRTDRTVVIEAELSRDTLRAGGCTHMSATRYYEHVRGILDRIHESQHAAIARAGELFASVISEGGRVYLFGSGHSVIPVMDIFPRYGSFVGFYPLYDPRLMWSNVIGPHGAR